MNICQSSVVAKFKKGLYIFIYLNTVVSHYSKLFYTVKSSVLVPYVTIPYLYLLYHITTKVSTLSKSTIYVYTVYIYSRPFPAFKRNNFSPYWMKANISLLYAESRRMAEHPSLVFFYTLTQFYPTIGGHYVYSTEVRELHCIWYMCWVKGKEGKSYIFITLYVAQRWESYTVYDI